MASKQPVPLLIQVEGGEYGPHEVSLNGVVVGYRPHDGSCPEEIQEEVLKTFAELLRERLGWPEENPEESENGWWGRDE